VYTAAHTDHLLIAVIGYTLVQWIVVVKIKITHKIGNTYLFTLPLMFNYSVRNIFPRTKTSFMQIAFGYTTGPIFDRKWFPVNGTCNAPQLVRLYVIKMLIYLIRRKPKDTQGVPNTKTYRQRSLIGTPVICY